MVHSAHCPHQIRYPVMQQRWDELTFMHWRYDPAVVQRLLPPQVEVETFDGSAWVALVPFKMWVGLPGGVGVPWLSRFAETNVRTYVRGPDGGTGVWFFSLEAERLAAVVTARIAYRLPYFWAGMRLTGDPVSYRYRSTRRWPKPPAESETAVTVGQPFTPDELGPLDHFLTARWSLYSVARSGIRTARIWHEPWPLHHATVEHLDDSLIAAAGLPAPTGDPLVHFSPGVGVRIGRPRRV